MAQLKILVGIDNNNQRGINFADPVSGTDAANKQYVDNVAAGLDWKENVRVASTTNINIASPGATINGVTMSAGDRFLAKDQTTGSQNGIYQWNGAAVAATRTADADTDADIKNAIVRVSEGSVNPDTMWQMVTDNVTIGTTSQTWTQFSGGGTSYIAGNGLTLTSTTFDVGAGTGISVAADTVGIDTSVVTRKIAFDCAATTNPQTFTHNFGTKDVQVTIRDKSTDVVVVTQVTKNNINSVDVDFGGAPTAAQWRVEIEG